jgi:CRP/FNR family transcriptional regulator, cyclic AMP receptor protein
MSTLSVPQLKEYPLFRNLRDEELVLLSHILQREEAEPGKLIITENEYGGELYLLDEGAVDISKTLTIVTSRNEFGTQERSFIRLTGADHCFFGEMALFGNRERSATVKAVTNCRLYAIRDTGFLALCETNPRIGYVVLTNIAVILSDYLRKANNDVLKLTTALSLALSE